MADRGHGIERIRPCLTAMLGEPSSIAPLPSGSTGPSYLVVTGAGRFVAKAFAPGSDALLGPAQQFDLLGVLADAGIAPRPVAVDDSAGVLVTEFLEGMAPLSPEMLRKPARLDAAARCLLRLHAVDVELPPFAPAVYAERYVGSLGGSQSLCERDRRRHAELNALARAFDGHPATLCHNDLLAENLLYGADGVKLIDFDYAVAAPPILDLASLVVMNDLSADEAQALLDAYFGRRAPSLPLEFAGVKRLVRLLAHFWALASHDAEAAIVARYRLDDD